MTDVIVILLISLPLITIGRTINSDSSINFGTRIPKSELKSEEDIKRSKRIKIALMLAGVITLAGGISCVIFEWEGLLFWIMLIPVTIAVIYMLLQLCMIQKNKNHIQLSHWFSLVSSSFSPLLIILPKTENDNDTIIKNDTLFIEGLYAKEIPISSITYINGSSIVPLIEMRTNGISFGALNVGHFRTKDQKDVLLYLHSDETNVTHIKTSNNEGVFINFKDPAKSAGFSNKLKESYLHQPTPSN